MLFFCHPQRFKMSKSSVDKIVEIYKKSQLSISKFAEIIGKDRRTVTSWIDKLVQKEPSEDVKKELHHFFVTLIKFGMKSVKMKSSLSF